jgi:hypothetical protein
MTSAAPPELPRYRVAVLDYDAAVEVIRKARGTRLFLHASVWLPQKEEEEDVNKDLKGGFVFSSVLRIRRQELLSFLKTSVAEKHRGKIQIRITRGKRCLFVGSAI